MKKMNVVIKTALVGALTIVCCIFLLVLSACIPRERIQHHSEISAKFFAEREPFITLIGNCINSIQDNYSDTVLCDIAYCIDTTHPLSSAIQAKYAQGEYEEAYEGYLAAVNGTKEPNREYGRYWHGSIVFIRPLLMIMHIGMIRVLCGGIIMILQLSIVVILIKKKKKAFTVCWLLALLLVHPWMFFTSLEYGTAFLTASAASLAMLLKKDHTDASTMPFFVAFGVITCFVDFLTTETLTFTLPMLLLLVERMSVDEVGERKLHGSVKVINTEAISVIKNGFCWLGGYLTMFAIKLVLLTAVAGVDIMKSSMDEGLLRLGGEVRTANISTAPVVGIGKQLSGAIWHNLACLYPTHAGKMTASGVCLVTLWIVVIGLAAVYLLRDQIDMGKILSIGMVAMLPYMRFMVLSNHSYVHFFITYRAQMVTIVAFLFFVYKNGVRQIMKPLK